MRPSPPCGPEKEGTPPPPYEDLQDLADLQALQDLQPLQDLPDLREVQEVQAGQENFSTAFHDDRILRTSRISRPAGAGAAPARTAAAAASQPTGRDGMTGRAQPYRRSQYPCTSRSEDYSWSSRSFADAQRARPPGLAPTIVSSQRRSLPGTDQRRSPAGLHGDLSPRARTSGTLRYSGTFTP